MTKPTKTILIGGSIEICGLINQMFQVYTEQGYKVIRLGRQSSSNDWYNSYFDIRQRFFFTDALRITRLGSLISSRILSSHRLNSFLRFFFEKKFFVRLIFRSIIIPRIDTYIHVWDFDFYNREDFFNDIKLSGVEFRLICVGSDFMDWPLFFRHFHPSVQYSIAFDAMKHLVKRETISFDEKMDMYEKYADVIFSAPTLSMHSKLKQYYNYILPIDSKSINFKINLKEKLRILHTPSIPKAKGTDIILKIIDSLRSEYDNFTFEAITNIQQTILFQKLSDADILIDELFAPGPASLAHEAACAGCIVMTFSDLKFRNQSEQMGGYFVFVDAINLKEKLRYLLSSHKQSPENFRSFFIPYLKNARKYVEENNDMEKSILRFIRLTTSGPFDFLPDPFSQNNNISR